MSSPSKILGCVILIACLSVCGSLFARTDLTGSPDRTPKPPISINPVAPDSCVELHFLDVGYGDAIFIRLPGGGTMLVDGGYEKNASKIYTHIKSFLTDGQLDWMICTHPHPDHIEGLIKTAGWIDVKNLVVNMNPAEHPLLDKLRTIISDRNPRALIKKVKRGDVLEPGNGFVIRVLHPEIVNRDLNYSSLALMFEHHGFRILLGGDMEQSAEKELAEKYGHELSAHVLKLPHHGNIGFSGFIPLVKPIVGIISVGENEWGAPHAQTLEILKKTDTKVLRTDRCGSIVLTLESETSLSLKTDKTDTLIIQWSPSP